MKTLVTGASGFIGSAIVRRLLGDGRDVRILVRRGSAMNNIDGLPVEITTGDLAALEAGVRRIGHTSSVATLATASARPSDETRPASPEDLIGP